MTTDLRKDEADRIVRGLSRLEGGTTINVKARKFPRFGPAERGTGLVLVEESFPIDQVPDSLPLSQGMDEIEIRVEGALDESRSTISLLADISTVLDRVQTRSAWDARTFLGSGEKSPRRFEVTVFTDSFGVVSSA